MPRQYEAIRDKAVSEGMSYDAAQSKAAAIYNAMRKKHPSMEKLSNKPDGKKHSMNKQHYQAKKK